MNQFKQLYWEVEVLQFVRNEFHNNNPVLDDTYQKQIDDISGKPVILDIIDTIDMRNGMIHHQLGTKKKDLQRLAINYGIKENVIFAGRVESQKLPIIYGLTDIFLMLRYYHQHLLNNYSKQKNNLTFV